METKKIASVLMLGTGEYTTGIIPGNNDEFKTSQSDKKVQIIFFFFILKSTCKKKIIKTFSIIFQFFSCFV